MRVLLTGANGFIGRYLLARLIDAGHQVVPAVRRPAETDHLLPEPSSVAVDLNRDLRPEDWHARLAGIDAIVNCAGILQARRDQSIHAIHAAAPIALFTAARQAGIRRVIQISAISAEAGAGTDYAATKREADTFLQSSDLDWVVLRPSLVYAAGAYGGTALFRALAALPVIPLAGSGESLFQPIHIDDLSAIVLRLLERPDIRQVTIPLVGPDTLSLRQILGSLRGWLGYKQVRFVEIPIALVRTAAWIGGIVGGPVNSTALRQMAFGNTGPIAPLVDLVGVRPRRWADALLSQPAQAQDRWHARLYFLRPLLRLTIAAMWLASGIVGMMQPLSVSETIMAPLGLGGGAAFPAALLACCLDIAVGIAVLARWRTGLLAIVQLVIILAYTAMLSDAMPALWIDPFGPLLKNLPIAAAILVLQAIEPER